MAKKNKKLRLDEILIKEGLISEEQVKEALMRQHAHGGKFGSQLLYHRYINESALVKALSKQFNCEGVVLGELEIPDLIIKMVPSKIAVARKVLPFDYDTDNNILKIACETPTDSSLHNELSFVARGKEIKLYVAAELALNTAIAKYYLGYDTSLDNNLLLEIPDFTTDTGKVSLEQGKNIVDHIYPDEKNRGNILLVTDEEYTGPLLQSLLERDNYHVLITDSADDAIEMLEDKQFHTVFIKDTVSGDYLDLIDRLRKISPRTVVRYYESASALLLDSDPSNSEGDLLIKNLELFTSLLSLKDNLSYNYNRRVGKYVEKLCSHMQLPHKEKGNIINAAYIHDLSRYYYKIDEQIDPRNTINLTVKLLQSLNYSPVIIEMLRSMYIDLKKKYTKRLPIEVLGGNILTIVDLFCDNISFDEKLTLDKFDAIEKKIRDLTGKLFLAEVAEAFIITVKEEILQFQIKPHNSQIMIFATFQENVYPLELRLQNEGFRTLIVNDSEVLIKLYHRHQPEIMILLLESDDTVITASIEKLIQQGVNFKDTRTFIMVKTPELVQSSKILEKGIEDVIGFDGNLDLLIVKLIKIQEQLQTNMKYKNSLHHNSGTQGRLADMNLIDLIQALGPSRRTVKIIINHTNKEKGQLQLYLKQGQIVNAVLKEFKGAEAVYEAIAWTDGIWSVTTLPEEDLPEPNTDLNNESILMEGCRIIDEKAKAGNLI